MIKRRIKGNIYRRYDRHSRIIVGEVIEEYGSDKVGEHKVEDWLIFIRVYYGTKLRGRNKIYIRDETQGYNRIRRYKKGSRYWEWCNKQRVKRNGYIKSRDEGGAGEET